LITAALDGYATEEVNAGRPPLRPDAESRVARAVADMLLAGAVHSAAVRLRLSSRTVAGLLPNVDPPTAQNADAAWDQLNHERDRITLHVEELTRARDELDQIIDINRRHRAHLDTP
jgi:hypothetical protein